MSENPWIEWSGGPCPVEPWMLVEIKLQHNDGEVWERGDPEEAGWFDTVGWWDGSADYNRIIAYRLARARPTTTGESGL